MRASLQIPKLKGYILWYKKKQKQYIKNTLSGYLGNKIDQTRMSPSEHCQTKFSPRIRTSPSYVSPS